MLHNAMRPTLYRGRMVTMAGGFFTLLSSLASGQTGSAPASTPASPASRRTPAYEVATIKPAGLTAYAMPLRVYIQSAYGIPPNSKGWVIGPDWINTETYVIRATMPEEIENAMKTMTKEEKRTEVQLMMQALLADRFMLKAHFETREMPEYELTLAKGGPKLKEDPDPLRSQIALGAAFIKGTAASMANLTGTLESVPDIGGRIVVDKTGLAGTYDFRLKWKLMEATAPAGDASGSLPTADAEGVSLFTAVEEQLGLRLVAVKGPGQVLVIDHMERPSEN